MSPPFVRYFCHVARRNQVSLIAQVGFDFFLAFFEAAIPIRVVPILTGPGLAGPPENMFDDSQWEPYARAAFGMPVPEKYVNVVCGTVPECTFRLTGGVTNIAIVLHSMPLDPRRGEGLSDFDEVWTPSADAADYLTSVGELETCRVILPTADAVRTALGMATLV